MMIGFYLFVCTTARVHNDKIDAGKQGEAVATDMGHDMHGTDAKVTRRVNAHDGKASDVHNPKLDAVQHGETVATGKGHKMDETDAKVTRRVNTHANHESMIEAPRTGNTAAKSQQLYTIESVEVGDLAPFDPKNYNDGQLVDKFIADFTSGALQAVEVLMQEPKFQRGLQDRFSRCVNTMRGEFGEEPFKEVSVAYRPKAGDAFDKSCLGKPAIGGKSDEEFQGMLLSGILANFGDNAEIAGKKGPAFQATLKLVMMYFRAQCLYDHACDTDGRPLGAFAKQNLQSFISTRLPLPMFKV